MGGQSRHTCVLRGHPLGHTPGPWPWVLDAQCPSSLPGARGRRRSPPAGPCPGRGTRRWPRAAPGVRPGQRQGVLTCCRASGRPLTTGSGRCPRPWLSSCDERADGGLGHAQAGSAVLSPGGAVRQHSGAVAASPAPMDPKPPSRRKAEGPDAATRLAAALHALLWDSHRWGWGRGWAPGPAPPRPGSRLRTPQRAQDGALPPPDPHGRSRSSAGPVSPSPWPSP